MEPAKLARRASGVLLHPTSLPGGGGSGDLGAEAHAFIHFLAAAGQRWWQMLPVGPAGGGNSPYSSPSTFAGNPLLVSLETLAAEGLLDRSDLERGATAPPGQVDFASVIPFRTACLARAAGNFLRAASPAARQDFAAFCRGNRAWLDDYALFEALRARDGGNWLAWPDDLRRRKPAAIERARDDLAPVLDQVRFVQYQFARQWTALRAKAAAQGVGLIGDVPIFVPLDSADVWSHPGVFDLRADGRPRFVAGVPPDYFSKTGQLWGNPHYRWKALAARRYDWWIARLRMAFSRFDAVRLDHFIGFARFWAIPAGAPDAVGGRWRKGPGADFFRRVFAALGRVELIAEDLGATTPEVDALRDAFDLPGMRILQFAFGDDAPDNPFKPHNYAARSVVYTGTHDNDTTAGWFHDDGNGSRDRATVERERARALAYLGTNGAEIHWELIRAALASVAATAILPAQDLLGLGSPARMNRPGESSGNWEWRLADRLPEAVARRLRGLTETYGRLGSRPPG